MSSRRGGVLVLPQNLHGATRPRGVKRQVGGSGGEGQQDQFCVQFCDFLFILLFHFWVHFLASFWDPFGVQKSPWRGQVGAEKATRRHQEAPKQQTGDTPKVL